jgi:hypothetical protein
MSFEHISEPSFLITELRYTLGQLHVQLGDLDASGHRSTGPEGRTVDQILSDMLADERDYQDSYRRLLHLSSDSEHREEALLGQTEFEHARNRTVAILEKAPLEWPAELLALVKEQLGKDRARTTEIAQVRIRLFEHDDPGATE